MTTTVNSVRIGTDNLNDGKNMKRKEVKDDLHYSAEGCKTLEKRFAGKAIALIRKHQK